MEKLVDKIKLPSSWMLVNPDSVWKYIISIAKTGNIFNKDQLIKSGLYTTNEDNISRNLSYLKYLGIIEEERGNGKDQRFKVIDSSAVKDILYEIKANREEAAKGKFKDHLKTHLLFTTLKEEFFKNDTIKTLTELEHFLKDGIPGKTPIYYQKGGEFLIKLLNLVSLAELAGNDITLQSEKDFLSENEKPIAQIIPEKNEQEIVKNTSQQQYEEAQIIIPEKYIVHFIGPGMNTKLEINEEDDLIIVEATLSKIKKKLNKNETN